MKHLLPVAVLGLAAVAAAQTASVTIPKHYEKFDGERQGQFPFGSTAGRMQQVVDGSQIAPKLGVIHEFAYRQDAFLSSSAKARKIARVIVTMGHTKVKPGAMSLDFPTNRTGTMSKVFDGPLDLPAPGKGSPRPFDLRFKLSAPFIYMPDQGQLLLEIEIPGRSVRTPYVVDAAITVGGGRSLNFGTSGPFSTGDKMRYRNYEPSKLRPGGEIVVGADGLRSGYPALAMFGFSKTKFGALTLPFDLAVLGASKNKLYTSTELLVPLPLRSMFVGWGGSVKIGIPRIASLEGLEIFSQSLFLDRKSNRLGLVFSDRVDMTVGSGVRFTQQIVSEDPTATRAGKSPMDVGNVIQFTGFFR